MKNDNVIFDFVCHPKRIYVLACSFGPDSMALFNILLNKNVNFVVAHVNYHKRAESDFEEQKLREFCFLHKKEFELLDTKELKPEGNFQKWARDLRYEFFSKIEKKYNALGTFVAHNEDDNIETYLMQINKGGRVKKYGISKENVICGAHLIRPLLNNTKASFKKYCDENNVPYSIDKSNLSDDYSRNKIRHSVVEKLSPDERKEYINQITWLNNQKNNENDDLFQLISSFLEERNVHRDLSEGFLKEIKKQLLSDKPNLEIKIIEKISLFKEYGNIIIFDKTFIPNYCYELDFDDYVDDHLIKFSHQDVLDRNIKIDSFPITIKPINKSDYVIIKDYKKDVRRLFIDWKIPLHLRERWPGIYDKNGTLIYVPRYRENFTDNHAVEFKIKFTGDAKTN